MRFSHRIDETMGDGWEPLALLSAKDPAQKLQAFPACCWPSSQSAGQRGGPLPHLDTKKGAKERYVLEMCGDT